MERPSSRVSPCSEGPVTFTDARGSFSIWPGSQHCSVTERTATTGKKAQATVPYFFFHVGQQNVVFTGDFGYSDVCWENSTAVYKLAIRFLECIEDSVLLQMLDMLTRNSALLDLLLTNQDDLLDNVTNQCYPWIQQPQPGGV